MMMIEPEAPKETKEAQVLVQWGGPEKRGIFKRKLCPGGTGREKIVSSPDRYYSRMPGSICTISASLPSQCLKSTTYTPL